MSLKTYEDFSSLGGNALKDYLSVRGLNVSGKKAELVARAFVAYEMKIEISLSSEELSSKLKNEYANTLSDKNITDPNEVCDDFKSSDITKWVAITTGNIFEYILRVKDFDSKYIGKYKDQKAYGYFDGGLVGEITTYNPSTELQYVFCTVRSSMSVNKDNKLWIAMKISGEVICGWCSCMAGSSHCCNHIIAALYKLEYATLHNLSDPACTSVTCSWNASTKKDICATRITDLNVRKKSRSGAVGKRIIDENREQSRMREINQFDPRRDGQRSLTSDEISVFFMKIQEEAPSAVVIKSIEGCGIPNDKHFFITDVAEKCIVSDSNLSDVEKTTQFLSQLHLSENDIAFIEKRTRGQANEPMWKNLRKCQLTASIHHDIYTKVNTLLRSRKKATKYSPLVADIIHPRMDLSTLPSVKWGIDHEDDGFKAFYASEVLNHVDFKLEKCGLFICKRKPYIGASPDAVLKCKCHGITPVEIKCPHKIRDMKVKDGAKVCDFLSLTGDGKVSLKNGHKYATQLNSQMSLTGAKQGYFVVWTEMDTFIQLLPYRPDLWNDVSTNLEIFFKQYVARAILRIRPLFFCGKCEKVILEDNEIEEKEKLILDKLYCDTCSRYFHRNCVEMPIIEDTQKDIWICIECISSFSN